MLLPTQCAAGGGIETHAVLTDLAVAGVAVVAGLTIVGGAFVLVVETIVVLMIASAGGNATIGGGGQDHPAPPRLV